MYAEQVYQREGDNYVLLAVYPDGAQQEIYRGPAVGIGYTVEQDRNGSREIVHAHGHPDSVMGWFMIQLNKHRMDPSHPAPHLLVSADLEVTDLNHMLRTGASPVNKALSRFRERIGLF